MKNKMKMSSKLATALMDALCCTYLSAASANGYDIRDEEILNDASNFARSTFREILEAFEGVDCEWSIEGPMPCRDEDEDDD